MRIYLIRHTQAQVPPGFCGGWSDWPLADNFGGEARRIIAAMPAHITRIESSPLARCRLLAEKLGTHFDAPSHLDERLREIHFGAWENQQWDDIGADELNRWMLDWVNVAPPGGENFLDLQARVVSWWHDLPDGAEDIAIVSHAGPIRALLCSLLGMAPANAFRLDVELGAICTLKRDKTNRDAATLEKWNG